MDYSGLSIAMQGSSYIQTQLPQYLLLQLQDLGIDPNSVTSVTEAYNLIRNAENKENEAKNSSDNSGKKQIEKPAVNQAENLSLRQKVEVLAHKLGIQINIKDDVEAILEKIQNKLDALFKTAEHDGNEALYNQLVILQHQVDAFSAEAKGGGDTDTKMLSFMDMMAGQNRFMHNLN